jgi:fructose 1,6-bisphosphatase
MAFDPEGTLRFTLVREAADLSQTNGSHLYATTYNGTRFEIVDLETGKTVGRAAPKRVTWLLYLD